jgi:MFS family permease
MGKKICDEVDNQSHTSKSKALRKKEMHEKKQSWSRRIYRKIMLVRKSRYTVLLSVSLAMFTDMAYYGLYLALWTFTSKKLPDNIADNIYAMYGVGLVVCSLISGTVSDLLNSRRKPVIFGSIIGIISVIVLLFVEPTTTSLAISRLLHGFSSSIVYVVHMALVPDTFPTHQLTWAMAVLWIADSLGQLGGPALSWIFISKDTTQNQDILYKKILTSYVVLASIMAVDFMLRLFIRPVNIFLSIQKSRKKRHRRPGKKYLDWEEDQAHLDLLYDSEDEGGKDSENPSDTRDYLPSIPQEEAHQDLTIQIEKDSLESSEYNNYDSNQSEASFAADSDGTTDQVPLTMGGRVQAWMKAFASSNASIIGTDVESSFDISDFNHSDDTGSQDISDTDSQHSFDTEISNQWSNESHEYIEDMDHSEEMVLDTEIVKSVNIEPQQIKNKKKRSRKRNSKKQNKDKKKKRWKKENMSLKDMNPLPLLRHTEILTCCLIVMLGAISSQINETIVYSFAKNKFALDESSLSYLQVCFILPAIIVSWVLGSVASNLRGSRLIMIGFVLHVIAPPLMPICSDLICFLISCCFYCICRTVLLMPIIAEMGYALTYLGEVNSIAKVYGLYNCSYGIGMLIANPLSELFHYIWRDQLIGFYAFPVINAVLFPFYVVYSLRIERKRQDRPFEWAVVLRYAFHDFFNDFWRKDGFEDTEEQDKIVP